MRVVFLTWLLVGCSGGGDASDQDDDSNDTGHAGFGVPGPGPADPTSTLGATAPVDDSLAQLCVDTINGYRATLNLAPVGRWTSAEACVDDQCRQDSLSGQAHGAFGQCEERAQNECPGWPGDQAQSLVRCLEMMWAEGPGEDFQAHGHYITMSNPDYTDVACGFYTTPSGDMWAIQNFR